MMSSTAIKFASNKGEELVLTANHINGKIVDLLSQVSIEQTYQNPHPEAIEAVYTFPMPVDAVLLNMSVQIGQRVLTGKVQEKEQAEDRYENAITDGDSAIMLQQTEAGMYTANVGNIPPGERVMLKMSYAIQHELRKGKLRFRLPTVIAPRYGNWQKAGFLEHQIPETGLEIDNNHQFTFCLKAEGKLAKGAIDSPSHAIKIRLVDSVMHITLAHESAQMDQDLVINFMPRAMQAIQALAYQGQDQDGQVAVMAFFSPVFKPSQRQAVHIKLVLDCSGSMYGEKHKRTTEAALEVLSELKEGDYFNVTFFGSTVRSVFYTEMMKVTEENLRIAREKIEWTGADMGGTEMLSALKHIQELTHPEKISTDVLLITDGEVSRHQEIIDFWQKQEARMFTVGIGNSVTEVLVEGLAEVSGGSCELVLLNEEISITISRQFERMSQPRISTLEVQWPQDQQANALLLPKAMWANDTFWISAQMPKLLKGEIQIRFTLANGEVRYQNAELKDFQDTEEVSTVSTVARLVANQRIIVEKDEKTATVLAISYQLMTKYTHYLFVDERAEPDKFVKLPVLHKVKQMPIVDFGGDMRRSYGGGNNFAARSVSFVPQTFQNNFHVPSRTAPTQVSYSEKSITMLGFFKKIAGDYVVGGIEKITLEQYNNMEKPLMLELTITEKLKGTVPFNQIFVEALLYYSNNIKKFLDRDTNRFFSMLRKQHEKTTRHSPLKVVS